MAGAEQTVRIVETEGLTSSARRWIAARAQLISVPWDAPSRLAGALANAEGLIVRTYTRVDEGLLRQAPRLRVVGRGGVGLDNVDVPACRARGVEVVHTPDANTGAVTELLFALLLDVLRPRRLVKTAVDTATWAAWRTELVGERELSEMTLGIWGFGRVGRRVARAARGFGMATTYYDLLPIPEAVRAGATPLALERLIEDVDILTLHVDGRAGNRHLVNDAVMARRPPGSLLANLSRGFVVDAAAVGRALTRDPVSAALMDVHDPEPPPENHPLLHLENAYLLPHIGAGTRSAKERMSRVVEDVWRVLEGQPPHHPAPR